MNQTTPDILKHDALYSTMATGVIVSDANEIIEWVNPYFCGLLDTVPESLIGAPVTSLFNLTKLQAVNYVQRYEVSTDSGKQVWLQCSKTTVQDKDASIHHIRFITDISDFQARQTSRAPLNPNMDESRMDASTGVLNRKSILQELDTQVSRSRRYGNALSTIMLDYQFTHHVLSDKKEIILSNIANAIKANLRWVDQLGAMDAGRFLIILPESDYAAAEQAWDKINNELQELTMLDGQQHLHSELAISEWQTGDDKEMLIEKLEQGLECVRAA